MFWLMQNISLSFHCVPCFHLLNCPIVEDFVAIYQHPLVKTAHSERDFVA